MYVRPDLMAAQGLGVPNTWDEFFYAAERTTNLSTGVFGYIIRGAASGPIALFTQMYSYSGITNFFIDGVCTINHPLNVEFAERLLGGFGRVTSQDDVTKGWTEMAAQFQSGHAATLVHNLGSARANYEAFGNDTSKVLAVPLPVSVAGHRVIPSNRPGGIMMMAASRHKPEAWMLMNWLSDVEQDSGFHELIAAMPVNIESLQAPWIQGVSYMKMGADMLADPNTQLLTIPYHFPNFSTIMTSFVQPGIQSVLLGQMTVQELLDGWAELLQKDHDELMGR
jgi:multiple sugar transport system substrate-binding protein